jgi:sRNA-binding carbon storage regulator CsrA
MPSDDLDLKKEYGSLMISVKENGIVMVGDEILISWKKRSGTDQISLLIRAPKNLHVKRLETIDKETH